jgi:hypothetical protein
VKIIVVFCLILLVPLQVYTQTEAAFQILNIPVSPSLNSIGGSGASLFTDEPYGFLHNPAQLGYFGTLHSAALAFPYSLELESFIPVKISSMAVSIGHNFRIKSGVPLSIGLGYSRPELTAGRFPVTYGETVIGYFEPRDLVQTFSIGAAYEYYLLFSAGLSYKNITSEPTSVISRNFSAFDLGIMINAPLLSMINNNFQFNVTDNVPALPFLNLSAGYALQNLGSEIYYTDPAQSDPLPRMAKLGYGFSAGTDLKVNDFIMNFFRVEFTSEANDYLIIRDTSGFSYQSGLGDIHIGRNILGIKGDDKVISRSGFKIDLFDTFSYRTGKYSGKEFDLRATNGLEFRTRGILILLASTTNLRFLNYLAKHFDLRYYRTEYNILRFEKSDFNGFVLVLTDISFLN